MNINAPTQETQFSYGMYGFEPSADQEIRVNLIDGTVEKTLMYFPTFVTVSNGKLSIHVSRFSSRPEVAFGAQLKVYENGEWACWSVHEL